MPRDQVFISYSHADKRWLTALETLLRPLTRSEAITIWSDTLIQPGAQRQQQIEDALNSAAIAVLLVSPHFLASDFIAEHQLPPLLLAAQDEGLKILWVPVSFSLYEATPIGQYQPAIDPNRPLDSLPAPAARKALHAIATQIWSAAGKSAPPPGKSNPPSLCADTTAFVGRTRFGPLTPARIASWNEYTRTFGPETDPDFSCLGYCVRGFFQNGGREAWIVRIPGTGATLASATLADAARVTALDPGAWANDISLEVQNGSRLGFRILVRYQDAVEDYDNLSSHPAGVNYFCDLINQKSLLVRLEPLASAASLPPGLLHLCGGNDGAPLTPTDFLSQAIAALDSLDDVPLVCIPDHASTSLAESDYLALANRLIQHCEQRANRFALLTLPRGFQPDASLPDLSKKSCAALYWPWVRVAAASGDILVPPLGHIAGTYARNDAEFGIFHSPSQLELRGLAPDAPLEFDPPPALLGSLARRAINAIRKNANQVSASTALTLDVEEPWTDVSSQRFVLFVESSIQRGLRWVTFEENTPALWSLVAEHVSKFLDTLWENRFLAGTTRKDAAWVQCDRTTMTQDDIDNGRVICLVTLQPFNHQTGVLIQVLLQARGGESRSTAG